MRTNSYNLGNSIDNVHENTDSYVLGITPEVKRGVFGLSQHDFNQLKKIPGACYVFDAKKK